MQKLLTYQNAIGQYLNQVLTFINLQQICYELMRQDIVLINNNKTNELIKYTWTYCTQNYHSFTHTTHRITQLNHALTHSAIRAYYLAFIAKQDIQRFNHSLETVERDIVAANTNSAAFGRNSVRGGSSVEEIVVQLQNNFTLMFNYLTEKN